MRLHKCTHYFLLSIEHLRRDAAFSVCFPEAKVIEEHFIEHFIFLQTSKNIRHTIEEVGINLGNFKLSLILFVLLDTRILSSRGEVTDLAAVISPGSVHLT